MERLNKEEFSKIYYRFAFLLSFISIILVVYNYGYILRLIGGDDLPYAHGNLIANVILNVLFAFFMVSLVLKPVKAHVLNPTNKEFEQKAYHTLCKLPNFALLYLAITAILIINMVYTTYMDLTTQLHALILNFSFLGSLVGIFYLFANYRISFNLQHFNYRPDFVKISMRTRLGAALNSAIFGIIINAIFTFYIVKNNSGGQMLVGFYFLCILSPLVVMLVKMTLDVTIGPVNRILFAWDTMEKEGIINLPNICVGEMADLTYRFQTAMVQVQNQLKENSDLSQELSSLASDLSTNAETVSSTCENIASSQQFIAKGAAQQTNAILKISQKIDYVAKGIATVQEKVSHINNVSETIKSIANQTNILSLNAAIEAARAGEAGRGFNVVADQVRKLAQSSQNAVNNTDQMVKEIQNVADQQNLSVKELLHEITDLSTVAEETSSSTEEVSAAAEEQSASMEQISSSASRLANLASLLNNMKASDLGSFVVNTSKTANEVYVTPTDKKLVNKFPKIQIPTNSFLKN